MTNTAYYPDFALQPWQFGQRKKLPLFIKERLSVKRIEDWYAHWGGDVYISFSGGKDSTVLLDLVRKSFPDVPAVFVNTGLEYPEIREFVDKFDNVTIVRPKMSFKKVIEKYGYPIISKSTSQAIHEVQHAKDPNGPLATLRLTGIGPNGNFRPASMIPKKWQFLLGAPFKVSHKCCDVLKKNPAKQYEKESGRKPYIGTLATESKTREKQYLKNGCNGFNMRRPVSNPIAFWTEQDILQYLSKNSIEIAEPYGDIVEKNGKLELTGEPRTGCIFCGFGVQFADSRDKFTRLKKTHPHLHDYCMTTLKLKEVLDYIGIPSE